MHFPACNPSFQLIMKEHCFLLHMLKIKIKYDLLNLLGNMSHQLLWYPTRCVCVDVLCCPNTTEEVNHVGEKRLEPAKSEVYHSLHKID